jgi:hypothetical protein
VNKVEAIFVSTEGEYLEAVVEVSGERLHVMDEFGGSSMSPGQRIEIPGGHPKPATDGQLKTGHQR